MTINHRNNTRSIRLLTTSYRVFTLEGNQYLITYKNYASIYNTKMKIYRVTSTFVPFVHKELLASFQYNNKGPNEETDSRKLASALQSKSQNGPRIWRMEDMEKIALIVARALEINEYATIEIMKSFDQSSWEAKAEALIALDDMYEQHKNRNAIESIYPEDSIMQTKLRAVESYNDIMKELPSGVDI